MTTHTRPAPFGLGHLTQGGGLGLLQGQRNAQPPQAKGPASSALTTRPKAQQPRERHVHSWTVLTTCGVSANIMQCSLCLATEGC